MPKPKKNETLDNYFKRCIPEVMHEAGTKNKEHAVAKCAGMYRQAKKRRK